MPTESTRLAKLVFIGGLLVWIAAASLPLIFATPLGHDEARYATDTREVLQGQDKRYFYVPIGMNAVAAPALLLGGEERGLRVLPLAGGVLFLLAAWHLARRLHGTDSAHWVVGVLAGAHPMLKYSAGLLSDLPSAACLLGAIAMIVPEVTRPEGPGPRMIAAAPLGAAAFYLRYGSAVTLVIIAIVSLIVGARGIVRRPKIVLATLITFAALLLPFALYSHARTGSALGLLAHSAEVPPAGGWEALRVYFASNGFAFYGALVAPLMLVGVLAVRRVRATIALQAIGLFQIIVLGWTTLAESRYVFLATALLVIVGVEAVRRGIAATTGRRPVWLGAVATVAVVGAWIGGLYVSVALEHLRAAREAPTLLASFTIRTDAGGRACAVVGHHAAQLEWYSGCQSASTVSVADLSDAVPVYVVREPADPDDAVPAAHCPVFESPGVVSVVRLEPLASTCAARPRPRP